MAFLPDGYAVKDTEKRYMKFKAGPNKFRALSSAIIGWEWWVDKDGNIVDRDERSGDGGKPRRAKTRAEIIGKPEQYEAKEFWAFKVWNFQTEQVEILQIKQITIMRPISSLAKDSEWGSPLGYNITVHREDGEKTSYTVTPSPHSELEVDTSYADKINLEALYPGGNPFDGQKDERLSDEELKSIVEDKE